MGSLVKTTCFEREARVSVDFTTFTGASPLSISNPTKGVTTTLLPVDAER
jgi:hypothetical protein